MRTVNQVWFNLLYSLLVEGQESSPRGLRTKELLSYTTVVPMSHPVLVVPQRKLGYRFMAAEAAWILSGDNRVNTIQPFSREIEKFSDDGVFFFGAYGPKVRDQLSYVVEKLIEDPHTRHAVINIWREQPRKTKDVPCTLSLQFMIRGGKLHCFDTMRSSDAWLGWPYDVFNMSMISLAIKILLRHKGVDVDLGDLHLTAASQHLYEPQWQLAKDILDGERPLYAQSQVKEDYADVEELIEALWSAASSSDCKERLINGPT